MKTVPTGIQTKLDAGVSTLCYCWKLVRNDSVTMGFTDHDVDIVVDGTTYYSKSGFDATVLETDLGYNSTDISAIGVINSTDIKESDVQAGLYDDAEVTLLWVDWENPTDYITILVGYVGQAKINGVQIELEIKTLLDKLNRNIGRIYKRTCDALFCDSRCGLVAGTYTESGTISSVLDYDTFLVTGLTEDSNVFSYGVLTFTSGTANGYSFDVRDNILRSSDTMVILWSPMPILVSAGDTFDILQGCTKTLKACKAYNNIENFRGFPQIPGNSVLTQVASRYDANAGGSLIEYD